MCGLAIGRVRQDAGIDLLSRYFGGHLRPSGGWLAWSDLSSRLGWTQDEQVCKQEEDGSYSKWKVRVAHPALSRRAISPLISL
jgi:hypothetical protein